MKRILLITALFCSQLIYGQSSLKVTFGKNAIAGMPAIYLNESLVEYANLRQTPTIYLVVLDETKDCAAMKTSCGATSDFGNFNNCDIRHRPEGFFAFDLNDEEQLNSLDSVINQVLTESQSFALYTPISYSSISLSIYSSKLYQTLRTLWGDGLIVSDKRFALVGQKGKDFVGTNQMEDETLVFETPVCQNLTSALGIAVKSKDWKCIELESGVFTISNGEESIDRVGVLNSLGQTILNESINPNESITFPPSVNNGIYFIQAKSGADMKTFKIQLTR